MEILPTPLSEIQKLSQTVYMPDQKLILVDENDRFLDKYASRKKCHLGLGLHHRSFTVMILNKKGEVLLQHRKHQLWDKVWDLTNSHPQRLADGTDETYEEAIQKCLIREWGISIPVKKIFSFNYYAKLDGQCENEFCVFFMGKYNGQIFPNSEVAYGSKWIALPELLADIKINPNQYTPWAIKALKEFSLGNNLII